MTESAAVEWVILHQDDDPESEMTEEQLELVFQALTGRKPDYMDRAEGLWSHVCQLAL